MRRFRPGEAIALRELWAGRIRAARAATVVQDDHDQVTLFIPTGSPAMRAFRDGRLERRRDLPYDLAPVRYDEAHVLSFAWPEVPYAILRFYRPDWSAWSWYVNLQDPLRRSAVGFDTEDHVLDVIIELDGTWRWKDEDELADAVERGLFTDHEAERFRRHGLEAVRRLPDREPPFDREWSSWRPDPSWSAPRLPEGWERLDP